MWGELPRRRTCISFPGSLKVKKTKTKQKTSTNHHLQLLPLLVNPTAYLALIGGGDIVDEWKARHGQHNRIYCEGTYWHGDKLSQAYASADIFVLPSNFEALGNVILEAMASGVVAVGCNAGGVPHMIQHRKNGILFENGDTDGLAYSISELIDNRTLRTHLADAGRKYAESINWETSSYYISEMYHRIVKYHAEGLTVVSLLLIFLLFFFFGIKESTCFSFVDAS